MATENVDFVKMSDKGQLVVPQGVRELAGIMPGERFVAFPIKEGVLFKRIEMPKVKIDFISLSKEIEAQFQKNSVKESDVKEAVKWARKK